MYWSQSYSLHTKKNNARHCTTKTKDARLSTACWGLGNSGQFLPKHIRLSLAAVRRQTTYMTLPKRTEKKLSLVRPTDPLKLPFVNVRSALRGIFIAHFIKAIVLQLERML